MTYHVVQVTDLFTRRGDFMARETKRVGTFDTAGFALANADLRRSAHRDINRNIVTNFFARHASGRDVNETEMLARELYDGPTVDRFFPEVTLPF